MFLRRIQLLENEIDTMTADAASLEKISQFTLFLRTQIGVYTWKYFAKDFNYLSNYEKKLQNSAISSWTDGHPNL